MALKWVMLQCGACDPRPVLVIKGQALAALLLPCHPPEGRTGVGVSLRERADGTVLRICRYSLIKGFILEKTSEKLRAHIEREIEPK